MADPSPVPAGWLDVLKLLLGAGLLKALQQAVSAWSRRAGKANDHRIKDVGSWVEHLQREAVDAQFREDAARNEKHELTNRANAELAELRKLLSACEIARATAEERARWKEEALAIQKGQIEDLRAALRAARSS